MSGVLAPAYPITEPFGEGATIPTDITLPIPVPSQTAILVGAASFTDGFPAATRTDPLVGGVPPFGEDMNGILFMLSQYAALAQAGQIVPYNHDAAVAFGGYAIGARVASVSDPGRVWVNYLNANTNDPDSVETGWAAEDTLYAVDTPAAGAYNDVVLPGASDYALDVDTTAGDVTFTGFIAQRPSQIIHLSNTGANLLNLPNLTGSAANNQIRTIAGGLTVAQGQCQSLKHITGTLNKWLAI